MYMRNEERNRKIYIMEKCQEIMAISLVSRGILNFDLCLQLTIVMTKQTGLNILVDLHSN